MSTENRPLDVVEGAHFCMKCGKRLIAKVTPADKPIADVATKADRRQLTVIFSDLVGSTPLSEQLDRENLREVGCEYQETCGKIILRFEGHIAVFGRTLGGRYPTIGFELKSRAVARPITIWGMDRAEIRYYKEHRG